MIYFASYGLYEKIPRFDVPVGWNAVLFQWFFLPCFSKIHHAFFQARTCQAADIAS